MPPSSTTKTVHTELLHQHLKSGRCSKHFSKRCRACEASCAPTFSGCQHGTSAGNWQANQAAEAPCGMHPDDMRRHRATFIHCQKFPQARKQPSKSSASWCKCANERKRTKCLQSLAQNILPIQGSIWQSTRVNNKKMHVLYIPTHRCMYCTAMMTS
jgi:hypothetical protein